MFYSRNDIKIHVNVIILCCWVTTLFGCPQAKEEQARAEQQQWMQVQAAAQAASAEQKLKNSTESDSEDYS